LVIYLALNATTNIWENRQVNPWTRSNFNKKTPFQHFYSHFYFQHYLILKIQKYIYFIVFTYKTQKYLYCIILVVYYLSLPYTHHIYFIASIILFYLHSHLVLDNHLMELRTQDKEIVLQVAWRERRERFWLFPGSRYKPRVSSWRKFTFAITLCTWNTNEMAHCLVSSHAQEVLLDRRDGQLAVIHLCLDISCGNVI
jgi:hypothetical protein